MPLTPELRRGIDRIRDYLFGGGYPNPAQNAEQLSFLFFFYMFETADAARVRAARRPGVAAYASAFGGEWTLRNPRNAHTPGEETVPRGSLRWSSWANALNGERLVTWVREEVFPFYAEVAAEGVTDFMDGARLIIDEPTVLSQVVSQVNDLHLERVDADTKGDLFEHVLRQIRQAGELGQFRTPRHVIRAIVQLVDPHLGETVYDPAAGTAGVPTERHEIPCFIGQKSRLRFLTPHTYPTLVTLSNVRECARLSKATRADRGPQGRRSWWSG